MTVHSLLYVSKSLLPNAIADDVVPQIAAASVLANGRTGLTGALVFTGSHFAQILEGDRREIDKLLAAIHRDARHTELNIIERIDVHARRFAGWSMAYMGPSRFVSRHIMQLIEGTSSERRRLAAAWMSELMIEFSKPL